jgi:hypothetical protein
MRVQLNKIFGLALTSILIIGTFNVSQNVYANPFFSNGYFTENGIEWCEENSSLYEILEEKFFEHHKHSLESRICVSLYQDYYWNYEGPESYEESETGIIDTMPAENKDQTLLQGTINDGEMIVQIISSAPKINEAMEINLSFIDENNRLVPNVNFGINITQLDQLILESKNIYSEKGLSTLITRPLISEEPVSIIVTINGIGISENQEEWTGPQGKIVMFTIVPEFGTMSIILLATTISLMVFLSSKIKLMSFRNM